MIKEAIEAVTKLAKAEQRRPVWELAPDGSGRRFRYNDSTQEWMEEPRFVKRDGVTVSTLRSFADLVLAEAGRFGDADGAKGTVEFGAEGAKYLPDFTDTRHGAFVFNRTQHPAWVTLSNLADTGNGRKTGLKQLDLIQALQSLRPYIVDGVKVLRAYRTVDFSQNTSVLSQPLMDPDGKGGYQFKVDFEVRGAKDPRGQVALPSTIALRVPYTPRSEPLAVEIEVYVALEGSSLKFFVSWADEELLAQAAVEAEYEAFQVEVKAALPKLVILRNF